MPAHPGQPLIPITAPNGTWTADFKGQFKTRNGVYCYPLTVVDGFSRYLLACHGLLSTAVATARPIFLHLFQEYGLPRIIRTDNGVPFAPTALGRLSTLSVWWIRLGILPELIAPASPQQNGRHERMHRTLKAEATRPPSGNLHAQQVRFNRFRHEYNDDRPHEALDQETPGSVYQPSPRALPQTLAPLEYPGHFEVRLVSRNSGIRWKKHWVCVTHTLAGEYVGLEEVDDGLWDVYFGPVKLGRMNERILSALKITRAASSGEDRPRRPPSHGVVTPTMCYPCPWTDLSLMSPAAQLIVAAACPLHSEFSRATSDVVCPGNG